MATPPMAQQPPSDDSITPLVAAFVKKNWDDHYRAAWDKFGAATGRRGGTTWNWAAALFSFLWLAYRRRFALAFGLFVVAVVLTVIPFVNVGAWITTFIVLGLWADKIVLRRAWKAAGKALREFGPGEQATKAAAASGGVSAIGLVIFLIPTVAYYGFLALLFNYSGFEGHGKERSYKAQMVSDLMSLRTAEDTYFADSGRYARDLGSLFETSSGVDSPTIILRSRSSYRATVTHTKLAGIVCGMSVGMPNPVDTLAGEGEVRCK